MLYSLGLMQSYCGVLLESIVEAVAVLTNGFWSKHGPLPGRNGTGARAMLKIRGLLRLRGLAALREINSLYYLVLIILKEGGAEEDSYALALSKLV